MKRALFVTLLVAGLVCLGTPLWADSIGVYVAPARTYQNTTVNPCIFFGSQETGGNCAAPAGWPDPAGPTNQNPPLLTKDYLGESWTAFKKVAGTRFVLGLDINQTGTAQRLDGFTITFSSAGSFDGLTPTYSLPASVTVPKVANGEGWADYVLAQRCVGGLEAVTDNALQRCVAPPAFPYTPFEIPLWADGVRFTFDFYGNDGPDSVYLISAPQLPSVPEPASMLLLGTGLVGLAARLRRRK